ncbi:hypothetical protein QVD17_08168 [Tagetes erecta]|uniref:Uncharacterized protein n=1 Tax=Tagetes erecta TaxID=13708 RepID=A0AAD8L2I8_TARER|nr:hypothetical protein QVD17_08168 [Tagetes erecta]
MGDYQSKADIFYPVNSCCFGSQEEDGCSSAYNFFSRFRNPKPLSPIAVVPNITQIVDDILSTMAGVGCCFFACIFATIVL